MIKNLKNNLLILFGVLALTITTGAFAQNNLSSLFNEELSIASEILADYTEPLTLTNLTSLSEQTSISLAAFQAATSVIATDILVQYGSPTTSEAFAALSAQTGIEISTFQNAKSVLSSLTEAGLSLEELSIVTEVIVQNGGVITAENIATISSQTGIPIDTLQSVATILATNNIQASTLSAVLTTIDAAGVDIEGLEQIVTDADDDGTGDDEYTQDELDTIELVEGLEVVPDTVISRGATSANGPIVDTELLTEWVPSFMLMTQQFTALMIQQVQIIGSFFDAKHQLETQRLFQQKVAETHKDYHPSGELCQVGTFTRDLIDSQQRNKITRNVMAQATIMRALAAGDVKTSNLGDDGFEGDVRTRRKGFIDKFCNIQDNAGAYQLVCETNKDPRQQNADVNYTQTIDSPLTINVDFWANSEAASEGGTVPPHQSSLEEENLFAFLDQIFMNDAFPDIKAPRTVTHNFIKPYLEMRSLIGMRSVAQNSFAHIIAEKTVGPSGDKTITPYVFALLEEMGVKSADITEYIGSNPSYYAQMEVLTKKIFQHPQFISNLYDKPANVKRMGASLNAIKLMQDRDIHEAMLRREMLTSLILELQLRQKENQLKINVERLLSDEPDKPDFIYGDGAANNFGVGTFNENSGGGGF